MVRARSLTALGALAALTLAGCGGSGGSGKSDSSNDATTVHLKLLQFNPSTLTVPVGTKVRFVNDEVISHTVTTGTYKVGDNNFRSSEQPDGKLNAQLKAKGDSTTYVFASAGTYQYFCTIHKAMQGQVVVR